MKTCKRCGESKPLDAFARDASTKSGIGPLCRPCYNVEQQAQRLARAAATGRTIPPRPRSTAPVGSKRCPTCALTLPLARFARSARGDGYQSECKRCRSARDRAYRARAAVADKERHQAYRDANREQVRAAGRRYNKSHHATRADNSLRRRARKANAPVVEVIQRAAVIARDASTCYLCARVLSDEEITLDHVVALARGGDHAHANLRVACHPCNRRKGTKLLSEL